MLCAVGVWLLLAASDIGGMWARSGMGVLAMGTVDALAGMAVGILLAKMFFSIRARHARTVRNLEVIAEMNHHIRNALERIEFAAHLSHNAELIEHMHASTSRIEWALRELLPKSESDDE